MTKFKRILIAALALLTLTAFATPMLAQAGTSYIFRCIEYGDSGQDVVQLQKGLKKLGFFSGKASGDYLDQTVNAVRAYEYATGRKTTRYCTMGMQKHIYNDSSKKVNRTLHFGDSGDDVKALQRALKEIGYFHGTIGGNYLKQTQKAVKTLESDMGYKVTGSCSPAMQKLIRKLAG